MLDFDSGYQNIPWTSDPLFEIAWEYHTRCERYDQSVCTKKHNEIARPANSHEQYLISQNSLAIRRELIARVRQEYGETEASRLSKVINSIAKDFEQDWIKRHSSR